MLVFHTNLYSKRAMTTFLWLNRFLSLNSFNLSMIMRKKMSHWREYLQLPIDLRPFDFKCMSIPMKGGTRMCIAVHIAYNGEIILLAQHYNNEQTEKSIIRNLSDLCSCIEDFIKDNPHATKLDFLKLSDLKMIVSFLQGRLKKTEAFEIQGLPFDPFKQEMLKTMQEKLSHFFYELNSIRWSILKNKNYGKIIKLFN